MKTFENFVGKEENADNPTKLSTPSEPNYNFCVPFILSSAIAFSLDWSAILLFPKELKLIECKLYPHPFFLNSYFGKYLKLCKELLFFRCISFQKYTLMDLKR